MFKAKELPAIEKKEFIISLRFVSNRDMYIVTYHALPIWTPAFTIKENSWRSLKSKSLYLTRCVTCPI
jgi:hypothetical protein